MNDVNLPQHVAVIMDGNRRWARARGLPTIKGHEKGYEAVQDLMEWLNEAGIRYCTVYAFSTENWNREVSEVKYLMKLMLKVLKEHIKEFNERNIKLLVSGRIDDLSDEVQRAVKKAVRLTKNNTKAVLNIAFNGGNMCI